MVSPLRYRLVLVTLGEKFEVLGGLSNELELDGDPDVVVA